MKAETPILTRIAVKAAAALVAVSLLIALPSVTAAYAAHAESGKCGESLTWTLKDGVLTISGAGEMYDYAAGTAPAPWIDLEFDRLIISSGAASIGEYAFYDCDGLKSVVIPGTAAIIKSNAFRNCSALESIVIRGGAETICSFAFGYCVELTSVYIPRSVTEISDNAFKGDNFFAVYTKAGTPAAEYAAAKEFPCVITGNAGGDPDSDGEITVSDALFALRVAAKLTDETPEALASCDADGDDEITVSDALAILRVAAGLADSVS